MNTKLNLIWACGRAHKLVSLLVVGLAVIGLLGFATQSQTLTNDRTEPTKLAPDYALEWRLGEHRLRYFENSATTSAQWAFDAYACRDVSAGTLPPGRWRVSDGAADQRGGDAPIRLVPVAETEKGNPASASMHSRSLVTCGERGTGDVVMLPAHTVAWLAARNGKVIYVRP